MRALALLLPVGTVSLAAASAVAASNDRDCTNSTLLASLDASTAQLMASCQADTKFSLLPPTSVPTAAEATLVCSSCIDFVTAIQNVTFPRCNIDELDENANRYFADLVQQCNSNSTTTPTPTYAAGLTPVANSSSDAGSNNVGLIAGLAGGLAAVAVIAFVAYRCGQRRVNTKEIGSPNAEQGAAYRGLSRSPSSEQYTMSNSTKSSRTLSELGFRRQQAHARSSAGLWDDPAILTARIAHDAIQFGPLLSRGGYGEVFKGTYRGRTVAIKQLLPAKRKDLAQIDAFLSEIKLMSAMEHERIVRFVGVAWNSLSDACVVVEYMENGDLRSVVTRWGRGEEMRPQGFDADKVKIALHIAHALTYLHSLQPVVVHRDLKSKNILLNANYDAKLTDFGVSRERADSTMTAGVGSSLWMAPEVMLGERYDEKADVFSFGVVLSELDSHQLPYSHAKEAGTEYALSDTALLQLVSLGRLSVAFTQHADPDLVALGRDCIQLDPKLRPTSAEVLHRVHQAMRGGPWRSILVVK